MRVESTPLVLDGRLMGLSGFAKRAESCFCWAEVGDSARRLAGRVSDIALTTPLMMLYDGRRWSGWSLVRHDIEPLQRDLLNKSRLYCIVSVECDAGLFHMFDILKRCLRPSHGYISSRLLRQLKRIESKQNRRGRFQGAGTYRSTGRRTKDCAMPETKRLSFSARGSWWIFVVLLRILRGHIRCLNNVHECTYSCQKRRSLTTVRLANADGDASLWITISLHC